MGRKARLMETKKRRSGIQIMAQLIGLVKPLLHIMIFAIVLGTLGYLCAIFLTILAGFAILKSSHVFMIMIGIAIARELAIV